MKTTRSMLAAACAVLAAGVLAVGVDVVVNPAGSHLGRFVVLASGSSTAQAEQRETVSREAERAATAAVLSTLQTEHAADLVTADAAKTAYDKKIYDAVMSRSVAGLNEIEIWDAIALCETGGRWDFDSGAFSGGLGFATVAWDVYGNGGRAGEHTRMEQIEAARRLRDANGGSYGGWGCAVHQLNMR